MLTPHALHTSAGDRYQVDTGDKPRVWPSMSQKSRTRAYAGMIPECVTKALAASWYVREQHTGMCDPAYMFNP